MRSIQKYLFSLLLEQTEFDWVNLGTHDRFLSYTILQKRDIKINNPDTLLRFIYGPQGAV